MKARPWAAPGWAVVGLFLITAFAAAAAARDFLMPVAMAGLLFFVFTPLRRWMERRGIPQWVTATLVTLGLVLLLAVIVMILLGPAADLIASANTFAARIEDKLGDVSGPLLRLQELTQRIDEALGAGEGEGQGMSSSDFLLRVAEMGPILATQTLFVLLLLFFMMSSGDLLYLKIVQSFPTMAAKRQA